MYEDMGLTLRDSTRSPFGLGEFGLDPSRHGAPVPLPRHPVLPVQTPIKTRRTGGPTSQTAGDGTPSAGRHGRHDTPHFLQLHLPDLLHDSEDLYPLRRAVCPRCVELVDRSASVCQKWHWDLVAPARGSADGAGRGPVDEQRFKVKHLDRPSLSHEFCPSWPLAEFLS